MLARHCFLTMKGKNLVEMLPIEGLDFRDKLGENRGEPVKQLMLIQLGDNLDKTI